MTRSQSFSLGSDDPSSLVRKLELYATLSAEDKASLARIAGSKTLSLSPREDVVREGEPPESVHLVLSGWACRYKQLDDGRRQLLGFLLPGDFCDLRGFVFEERDHSIASLTSVRIAQIPRDDILELTDNFSRLARALWWSTLVDEAIEREWIVSLGQRRALERMGHLLCELFIRQRAVGLAQDNSCDLPLTQNDLADATGNSLVHTNRTLQDLRARGLIELQGKTLTVLDLEGLQRLSRFKARYLHLGKEGRRLDAKES